MQRKRKTQKIITTNQTLNPKKRNKKIVKSEKVRQGLKSLLAKKPIMWHPAKKPIMWHPYRHLKVTILKIIFVPVCSFVSVVPAWAMMAISVSHRLGRECDGSVSVLNSSGLVMAVDLACQTCDFQFFGSLQNAREFLKKWQFEWSISL